MHFTLTFSFCYFSFYLFSCCSIHYLLSSLLSFPLYLLHFRFLFFQFHFCYVWMCVYGRIWYFLYLFFFFSLSFILFISLVEKALLGCVCPCAFVRVSFLLSSRFVSACWLFYSFFFVVSIRSSSLFSFRPFFSPFFLLFDIGICYSLIYKHFFS